MKKILTFILMSIGSNGYSQDSTIDNEQQIKIVINQFFEALEKRDSVLLKNATMAEGQIWRIYANESPTRANMRFVEDDLQTLKDLPPLKEIALDFEINIHHDIAVAWVPYEFWLNGEFCIVELTFLTSLRLKMPGKLLVPPIQFKRIIAMNLGLRNKQKALKLNQ